MIIININKNKCLVQKLIYIYIYIYIYIIKYIIL